MSPRILPLALLALSLAANAAEPKKKEQKLEKLDLGLGNFKDLPKGGEMQRADPRKTNDSPSVSATSVTYTVVRVVHGRSFTRSADGAKAASAFDYVPLSSAMVTDKFSTVVRVKCPQKLNASIEVQINDPRGDEAMSAPPSTLQFRGSKSDEVDWTVDWEPTSVRSAGDFQFVVKVNNEVVGTYPIKFAETPAAAPKK